MTFLRFVPPISPLRMRPLNQMYLPSSFRESEFIMLHATTLPTIESSPLPSSTPFVTYISLFSDSEFGSGNKGRIFAWMCRHLDLPNPIIRYDSVGKDHVIPWTPAKSSLVQTHCNAHSANLDWLNVGMRCITRRREVWSPILTAK